MGDAIGQVLPFAVGVAISPVPIIAVILMLVTEHARVNGPAFIVGWIVGLSIIGIIVIGLAGAGGDSSGPPTWLLWLQAVLGVLLLVVAARQYRARPQDGDVAPTPKWMGAIDLFTPAKALGAGVLLSALNPKNLLLAVGAAATIEQTGASTGDEAVAYLVFALIASVGVATPSIRHAVLFGDLTARRPANIACTSLPSDPDHLAGPAPPL